MVDSREFDVLALSHHELDITDDDALRRSLTNVRPDVVVNLAAYTAVDRAESDEATCFAVNAKATGFLSQACRSVGAHFITISSDYVFDGKKGSGYVEDDPTSPLNVYGRTKLAGELLCAPEDTIVRTSWVMGVRGRNILHVIASRAAQNERVRFVNDQRGSATFAADLARALVTLIRERPGGLWHVANVGDATWFDIARYTGDLLEQGPDFVTAITTDELDPAPPATRPARSDLLIEKWCRAGWEPLPGWRDGVERLLSARAEL
jgi:dTDP-4-dehydrorhamnose reductase